ALAAGIELIARGFVLASHGELAVDPWAELGRGVDGELRPCAAPPRLNGLWVGRLWMSGWWGAGSRAPAWRWTPRRADCGWRCWSGAIWRSARAAGRPSWCTAG